MKLIVGLNNPEERFNNTRHNAGAMVLDHKLKDEVEAEKFRGQDMIHGPEIASDLRPVVYSSRNNPKQVAPLL